jgi:NitT/TauT family transport system substrate-binding protein
MRAILAGILAVALWIGAARAEVNEIRITRQPGIIYLPVVVMERGKLIQKAAASFGLANFTAKYLVVGGGGAAIDAMLSGNIDVATTGVSNLLLVWDRTHGGIKGYASSSATPLWLLSNNPNVHSLKDLTPADKIAVPTVKISSQAILLQIAARKLYGDADFAHFDAMTTTLGHPDAVAALSSGGAGLTGHFSGPPFQQAELKIPGVHLVTTSTDIMGGPISNAVYFGPKSFHDANPTVVKAFMQAAGEAERFIAGHPREACQMYLDATGEKATVDELVAIIQSPGMFYDLNPVGTLATAIHMVDTKVMKTRPVSWKDYFFAEAYDLPGN